VTQISDEGVFADTLEQPWNRIIDSDSVFWHASTGRDSGQFDAGEGGLYNGAIYFGSDENDDGSGGGNYQEDTTIASRGTADTPLFTIPATAHSAELSFWYFLETEQEPGVDIARVLVNGVPLEGATNQPGGELLDGSGEWRRASFDLSAYIGQTVSVQFEFDSVDFLFNQFEGWYVDDVLVTFRGFTPEDSIELVSTQELLFDGSSEIDLGTDTIRVVDHGLVGSPPVIYSAGGGTPISGLTEGQTYYVIVVDDSTIKLAATKQGATDQIAIDLTSPGTGIHSVTPEITGARVGGVGDLNGDGRDDVAIVTDDQVQIVFGREPDVFLVSGSGDDEVTTPYWEEIVFDTVTFTVTDTEGFAGLAPFAAGNVDGDQSEGPAQDEPSVLVASEDSPETGQLASDLAFSLFYHQNLLDTDFDFASIPNAEVQGELSFDDDVVTLPHELLDGRTDLTVEFMLLTRHTGPQTVLSGAWAGSDNEFTFYFQSSSYLTVIDQRYSANFSNIPDIADGTWHHFAVVRDQGSGSISLYVDGAFMGTQAKSMSALRIDPSGLLLGQDQDSVGGGFNPAQALRGRLDELRIWSAVRTAEEIADTWNRPLTGSEQGLLAYYPFNEVSGSTVISSITPAEEAPALRLDGVDEYIEVTQGASNNTLNILDNVTVEVKFELKAGAFAAGKDWMPLVWKGTGTGAGGRTYTLWLNKAGSLHFTTADGTTQSWINTASGSILPGQTYHFTGVVDRDNGAMRIYLNGSEVVVPFGDSYVVIENPAVSSINQPLRIGWTLESDNTYSPFAGIIEEVRIWNTALDATAIVENLDKDPIDLQTESGLVGYWLPSNVSGNTLVDASSSNNDAELVGGLQLVRIIPDDGFNGTLGGLGKPGPDRVLGLIEVPVQLTSSETQANNDIDDLVDQLNQKLASTGVVAGHDESRITFTTPERTGSGASLSISAGAEALGFAAGDSAAGQNQSNPLNDLILTGSDRSMLVFGSEEFASGDLSGDAALKIPGLGHLRGIGDFDGDGVDDLAGTALDPSAKLDESGGLVSHQVTPVFFGRSREDLAAGLVYPELVFESGRPIFRYEDSVADLTAVLAPLGDADGDGFADLAVADELGGLIHIYRGAALTDAPDPGPGGAGGAGGGVEPEIFRFELATPLIETPSLFDRPGLDLQNVTTDEQGVSAQIGDAFALEGGFDEEGLTWARMIGDVNADGVDDLLVEGNNTAYILLGPVDPDGLSRVDTEAAVIIDTISLGKPADRLGDIDGDGMTDLVFKRIDGDTLTVTMVLSDGDFGVISEDLEFLPRRLDQDWVDTVSTRTNQTRVRILEQHDISTSDLDEVSVHVLGFDGDDKGDLLIFAPYADQSTPPGQVFPGAWVLADQPIPGDINGDGLEDVAVVDRTTGVADLFYGRPVESFELVQTIANPAAQSWDNFGTAVAGTGASLLIGAPYDDTGGINAGAAYLFDQETGALVQTVANPEAYLNDYFGNAVAVSENWAIVGASNDDGYTGSAYIFDTQGSGSQDGQQLKAADTDYKLYISQPGLNAYFYNWYRNILLSQKTLSSMSFFPGYGAAPGTSSYDYFQADFVGQIEVVAPPGTPGVWVNDDGSGLYIDGDFVINNYGQHGYRTYWNRWFLTPGEHELGVGFNEFGGWAGVTLEYQLPGGSRQVLSTYPGSGDQFGSAVAISGDTAIVGAPYEDHKGTDSGSAYVYEKVEQEVRVYGTATQSSTGWNGYAWRATDGSGDGYYSHGSVTHTLNDYANAYWETDLGSRQELSRIVLRNRFEYYDRLSNFRVSVWDGDVEVFGQNYYQGSGYVNTSTGLPITLPDGLVGDRVRVQLLGANNRGDGYLSLAEVEVYAKQSWQQVAELTASDGAAYDNFGCSVAISGDTAVVGARYDDGYRGSAYVFEKNASGNWVQTRKLTAPDGAAYDYFGTSVAIAGDVVVVGAYGHDTGGFYDAGAVYRFDASTGEFLGTLTDPDPEPGDRFGWSVAVVDQNILVGTPGEDANGQYDVGTVFRFDLETGSLMQTIENPAPAAYDRFGQAMSAAGHDVLVGTPYDDTGSTDAGAAYLFTPAFIPAASSDLGGAGVSRVSVVGDLNRDGYDDMALSSAHEDGSSDAGALFVFFGGPDFSGDLDPAHADLVFSRDEAATLPPGAFFEGGLQATAGDYNADGRMDLVIGEPWRAMKLDSLEADRNDRGRVYIYFSAAEGNVRRALSEADVILEGEFEFDALGTLTTRPAADINGDGIHDLMLGAAGADGVVEGLVSGAGRVYLVPGTAKLFELPDEFEILTNWTVTGSGDFIVDRGTGQPEVFEYSFEDGQNERWFRLTTLGDGQSGNAIVLTPAYEAVQQLAPVDAATLEGTKLALDTVTINAAGDGTGNSGVLLEFDLGAFLDFVDDPAALEQVRLRLDVLREQVEADTPLAVQNFVSSHGKLFFTAKNGQDEALWVSDGTLDGTHAILPDVIGNPANLTDVGGTLYFTANPDAAAGTVELWTLDPETEDPHRVQVDLVQSSDGVQGGFLPLNATHFVADGQRLYFVANDTALVVELGGGTADRHGTEVWASAGSTDDTFVLDSNAVVPRLGIDPLQLTPAGDSILFPTTIFFSGLALDGNGIPVGGERIMWLADTVGTQAAVPVYLGGTQDAVPTPTEITSFRGVPFFVTEDGSLSWLTAATELALTANDATTADGGASQTNDQRTEVVLTFSANGQQRGSITLGPTDTADNVDLVDLMADLNRLLDSEGLGDEITAALSQDHVVFTATVAGTQPVFEIQASRIMTTLGVVEATDTTTPGGGVYADADTTVTATLTFIADGQQRGSITLTPTETLGNDILSDLVADLNGLLAAEGLGSEIMAGLYTDPDSGEDRIQFTATGTGVKPELEIEAYRSITQNGESQTQPGALGFLANQQGPSEIQPGALGFAAEGQEVSGPSNISQSMDSYAGQSVSNLTAVGAARPATLTGDVAIADGHLTADIDFTLVAGDQRIPITLTAAETSDNFNIEALIAQLNGLIADAGAADAVVAGQQDNLITFTATTAGGDGELRIEVTETEAGGDALGFADGQTASGEEAQSLYLFFLNELADGTMELRRVAQTGSDGQVPVFESVGVMVFESGVTPQNLFSVGDRLFFTVTGPEGTQIWISDGNQENTGEIAQIPGNAVLSEFTDVDGTLYFKADTDVAILTGSSDLPENGQLSSNVGFTLAYGDSSIRIDLDAADTSGNGGLEDLVEQINGLIEAAGAEADVQATLNDQRLTFSAVGLDSGAALQVVVDTDDAGAEALGFAHGDQTIVGVQLFEVIEARTLEGDPIGTPFSLTAVPVSDAPLNPENLEAVGDRLFFSMADKLFFSTGVLGETRAFLEARQEEASLQIHVLDTEGDLTATAADALAPAHVVETDQLLPESSGVVFYDLTEQVREALTNGHTRLTLRLDDLRGPSELTLRLGADDEGPGIGLEVTTRSGGVLAELYDDQGARIDTAKPVIDMRGLEAGTYYLRVFDPSVEAGTGSELSQFKVAISAPIMGWFHPETDRDEIHGGDGDDLIIGNAMLDKLYGDSGFDFFRGESMEVFDLDIGDSFKLPAVSEFQNQKQRSPDPELQIQDPGLRGAIGKALDLPVTEGFDGAPVMRDPIYASDLAELYRLDLSSMGIEDLTGLEYAINVRTLNLTNNPVEDISMLRPGRVLTGENAGTLKGMPNLEALALDFTSPVELSALSSFRQLVSLSMDHLAFEGKGTMVGDYYLIAPGEAPAADTEEFPQLETYDLLESRTDLQRTAANEFGGGLEAFPGLLGTLAVQWNGKILLEENGLMNFTLAGAAGRRLIIDGIVVHESLEPSAVLSGQSDVSASGQLTQDVAFSIFIGTRPVLIQLDAEATAANQSIDDLVAQLNAQLEDTGIVCDNDGNRITFATEKMEGGTELKIYVADGQVGADGLGFVDGQESIPPQAVDVQVELQVGIHDIRYEVIGLSPDLAEIGVQLFWDNTTEPGASARLLFPGIDDSAAAAEHLRFLSLAHSGLIDASGLATLESLEELYLEGNSIRDISGLVGAGLVDNGDPGFEVTAGEFLSNINPVETAFEQDYLFSAPAEGNVAQWTFDNLNDGTYEIFVTWPSHESRSKSALYRVFDADDAEVISLAVNQQVDPAGDTFGGRPWQSLGLVEVTDGVVRVTLTSDATDFVAADAVRLEAVDPLLTNLGVLNLEDNPLDNRAQDLYLERFENTVPDLSYDDNQAPEIGIISPQSAAQFTTGAIQFTGIDTNGDSEVSGYMEVAQDASNNTLNLQNQLTLELIFQVDPAKFEAGDWTWMPLVYKGDGSGSSGRTYSLWLHRDGKLHFASADARFGQTSVNTPVGSIKPGQTYHVAAVMDRETSATPATELKVYLDGELAAQTNLPYVAEKPAVYGTTWYGKRYLVSAYQPPVYPSAVGSLNQDLRIGGTSESNEDYSDFVGTIDEVRIWSVVRDQKQIAASMNAELTGTESNLFALWKFDETSGITAEDSSTYNNDGTFLGDWNRPGGRIRVALGEPDGDPVFFSVKSDSPDIDLPTEGGSFEILPGGDFQGTAKITISAEDGIMERPLGGTDQIQFDYTAGANAIYGNKFLDADGDGVRDAGESGLESVTIFLDDNLNGERDSGERVTYTDANGDYAFTNLINSARPAVVIANIDTPANGRVIGENNFVRFYKLSSSASPEDLGGIWYRASETQSHNSPLDLVTYLNEKIESAGLADEVRAGFDAESNLLTFSTIEIGSNVGLLLGFDASDLLGFNPGQYGMGSDPQYPVRSPSTGLT
jgi:ELWxxDGT repeat protein